MLKGFISQKLLGTFLLHFRGHKSYITCTAIFDTFVFTGSADTTGELYYESFDRKRELVKYQSQNEVITLEKTVKF